MEVCRYEDMEAYGRISAKRCSRTETGRRSHKGTNPQGFTYTVKHFNISMLMEKEPVYLAFSTQKGGAGKTTLTVLFASYLHYVKGYDVAVVDCDYPQHSIAGMRQRDLKLALEDNHYKALAYEQFTRLGKKAYPVVESSTERAIDDAERITGQAAFDLVFFDLPGTVNNPSVIRALSNMDYIIAPISADRVVLESTLRYMTVVNDVIRKTGVSNIKGTYLVWNMVDGREKSELYEVYEQVIAELGLHVLKTFIPDSKRFRRELSAGHRPLFRSTLFPADRSLLRGSNIEALTDEVLTLLNRLKKSRGLTYLFIAHDLLVVQHISHRIAVMYLGRIVEVGTSDDVIDRPQHPYTQSLISAIPIPDPDTARTRHRIPLEGDVPSPLHMPPGCPFRTRCRYATDKCARECPPLAETEPGHSIACWNPHY